MKPGILLHRIASVGLKGVVALILAEIVFLAISITAALVVLSNDSWMTSLLCLVLVFFLLNRIALGQVVSSLRLFAKIFFRYSLWVRQTDWTVSGIESSCLIDASSLSASSSDCFVMKPAR